MDPNEYQNFDVSRPEENGEPQQQDQNLPGEENQQDSLYHGAGTGRKESPYVNSPYYAYHQNPQNSGSEQNGYSGNAGRSTYQYQQSDYEKAPAKKEKPAHSGKTGRAILAALLAVVLVAGSSGITAWIMNEQMKDQISGVQNMMSQQIAELQDQIENAATANAGIGTSGSPVSGDGLMPSQVYSQNVNSVVAISSAATVSNGWYGPEQQAVSTGSGFIITEDGYVVTNYHVVEGGKEITVITYLGEEYDAQLVGHDELNDVALLKVEATGLDAVRIGSSDDLIVGDQVVAIGNPLGELTSTQTVGYISGKDRAISTDGSIINMLQTDAAINSGNSGGPLFNMKGEVVGITTAKYSGSTTSGVSIEGIGFAIPIDDVMNMIDDLRDYGYLKNQAYLGVVVMAMDSSTAQMYSLPSGSYVQSVEEGGSADRAGVKPKDIIIGVGDYEVAGNSELTAALRKFSAGDTTTITVYRAGQEIELEITFDEKPQGDPLESTDPTEAGEMPENGSYEEWYNYFAPFFGNGKGND